MVGTFLTPSFTRISSFLQDGCQLFDLGLLPKNIEFAYKLKNLTSIFLHFHSLIAIKVSILDVLQGSEYTSVFFIIFVGLLFWIHVQILFNSFTNFARIYLWAALINCFLEWARPCQQYCLSGLIVVGGLIVGVVCWNLSQSLKDGRSNSSWNLIKRNGWWKLSKTGLSSSLSCPGSHINKSWEGFRSV